MSNQPLVSIIVPVYNSAAHLERCVQSLTSQTYANIEIILIDDGSTDHSGSLCDALQATDDRIRVFHGPNRGVSRSRNTGIRMSGGEFIQFVDSDDFVDVQMSQTLVAASSEANADLVMAGYVEIDGVSSTQRVFRFERPSVLDRSEFIACFRELQRAQYINSSCNKLYRRSLIFDHGIEFPEHLAFAEDELFNLQYMKFVRTVAVLDDTPYNYVRFPSGGSLSFRNRPNIYEIAMEEVSAMRELFHDSPVEYLRAEREYALSLATQILPYLALTLARVDYGEYIEVAGRIRADEAWLRHHRDLKPNRAREFVLLRLFDRSRFDLIFALASFARVRRRLTRVHGM